VATIEIDFDVFKALTLRRESEDVTYNDVLRTLLQLPGASQAQASPPTGGCMFLGVHFPEGTEFQVTYKGRTYRARIQGGAWIGEDGAAHTSPSEAAHAITKTNVNGWRFWKCRRPGDSGWRLMNDLRS